MVLGDPHSPTLAARLAARAAVLAAALFGVLVVAGSAVAGLRVSAPWATTEPFASLVGLCAAAAALLAAPTWLRSTVHGGPVPAPPHAVRAILTGVAGTLTCVAVGAGLSLVAVLARSRTVAWSLDLTVQLVVLVAVCALTALAAQLQTQARALWRHRMRHAAGADAARPDILDDAATLVAHWWPGSVTARLAAWLVRGLDLWSWSPRRHRTTFVGAAAVVTGSAWALWHGIAEGPWASPAAALAFAAVTGSVVAAGLAGGIAWLGLLRAAPTR